MKNLKVLILAFLMAATATISSCKKEDMSQYVKKSELQTVEVEPNPKIENINITVQSSQWVWNSTYKNWEYFYPHSSTYKDALIGFVMNGQGKQALPFYNGLTGVTFGLVDETFNGQIRLTYYDGSASLARPAFEQFYYLKIIPSAQIIPNVDYSNYSEVAEAHGLVD